MAPGVGIEPTHSALTERRSTAELPRNICQTGRNGKTRTYNPPVPNRVRYHCATSRIGSEGLEPPIPDSKPGVLPLDDNPKISKVV